MSKSSKKEIKQAVKVAKALEAAKEKVSKKSVKAQEKVAKKSQEYARALHEDGFFGGAGAQARARQRHFDSTGQTIVKHPGSIDIGVKEDDDGAAS
jgi:hypothetical protein